VVVVGAASGAALSQAGIVQLIGPPSLTWSGRRVYVAPSHSQPQPRTPQTAIDGPRFRSVSGLDINVEREFPAATLAELERRGHRILQIGEAYMDFGCAQIAYKVDGGYVAASDPRRDSLAVG
jgi:gamma-glutamyltranspeptidase/glutathione hydrolase